jgi:hypothetical protein
MGLIEFFKNLFKTPIPSRFEDMYNFDFPALLKRSKFIGKEEKLEGKLIYYTYECTLDHSFLNAFKTLRITLSWEEKEIKPDLYILLTFLSKRKHLTDQQIAYVVDSVLNACNDEKYADLNKGDAIDFKNGTCKYMCPYLFGDCTVGISNDINNGISVTLGIPYADLKRLAQEQKL